MNFNPLFILLLVCSCTFAHFSSTENDHHSVKAPPTCPNNCSFPFGRCQPNGTCICEFSHYGNACQENVELLYEIYCWGFSFCFALLSLLSGIQVTIYLINEGCTPTIPKILMCVFLFLGIERVVWLLIDPHDLKHKMNPVVENILFGVGDYLIFCAYMLVVMLWSKTYKKSRIGTQQSWFLKHSTSIFAILIVLFGIIEVVLRIFWRKYEPGSFMYMLIVGLYYLLLVLVLIIICGSFLVFGLRLYRNFLVFESNNGIRERMKRVTFLTVGLTVICAGTLFWSLGSFSIELKRYHFEDTRTFLIEQYGFRVFEIGLSFLIVYFLRYQRFNVIPTANLSPSKPSREPSTNLSTNERQPLMKSKTIS